MDTISLKKYIYDNQKIEYVLSEIGCKDICYHSNKEYYSCGNYNGDNPNAINVKNNEYLHVRNWTRPKYFNQNSDLISLVQYNKNYEFIEAIKYLHKILGLSFVKEKSIKTQQKKEDPLDIFKKVKCRSPINVLDINVIDEILLNDYVPLIHIQWLREGIMPWTAKKFGLTYSYKRKRVVIPMRYWLTGELMGTNMRTTVDNYKEFGIKKYYLTPTYQKNINLFGLYENYNDIQKAGYVVVYEAEKSVLRRDSLNDATGVALSGKTISDEQIRILVGLNVDIIIALDKDVPIEEVRYICEKFYNVRNVSYIYDSWDLLKEKDSPADAKNKVFEFLMKYKIKYDSIEHKKYLDSLKTKTKEVVG